MLLNAIYLIIFVYFVNVCVGVKYDNYTLFRAIPVNQSHIEFFSTFDKSYDINFWRSPGLLYRAVEFVINPKDQSRFLREAEKHGVYLTTIINDVQVAFNKQTVKTYIRRQMNSFNWNNYFTYSDIWRWLTDLSMKYPNEVKILHIGQSYEGRNISALKVLMHGGNDTNRPRIIIEGGIHAREWIAPAFVTYLINQIVHANTTNDEDLKCIAKHYEWYFIPVLNVDGYIYSHTVDRLWRKNRHGNGVDLNRNFGYGFGTRGADLSSRSEQYCGSAAFSEKESQNMAEFVISKSQNLQYYIAFHSYGQYMILPYANSKKHMENFDEVYNRCKLVAKQIATRYRTKYKIGTAYETVGYMSSGVSGCWVKNKFKVPYVITFELRDDGKFGFALPPDKILPTCKETMDGLIELFRPRCKLNKITLKMTLDNASTIYQISVLTVLNVFLFIILNVF